MSERPLPARGPRGSRATQNDLARHFLAVATALAPASRRDWSRAMLAELDQVAGRRARWRFAAGAAHVALLPPRSSRRAAIVLAAIAVAAGLALHAEVPRAGAVALYALPGIPALCAWAALAWPRPSGPAGPAAHAVQVIAAAAMIACPVLGVRLLTLYPGNSGPTSLPGQIALVLCAAEIAVFLLLTGPAAFIVYVLTTSRAAVTAQAADRGIIILAHRQGATSVTAWVASNDLGLAIVLLTAVTVVAAVTFLMARFGFVPAGSDLLPGPFAEG